MVINTVRNLMRTKNILLEEWKLKTKIVCSEFFNDKLVKKGISEVCFLRPVVCTIRNSPYSLLRSPNLFSLPPKNLETNNAGRFVFKDRSPLESSIFVNPKIASWSPLSRFLQSYSTRISHRRSLEMGVAPWQFGSRALEVRHRVQPAPAEAPWLHYRHGTGSGPVSRGPRHCLGWRKP